jgi:phosphatidate phosphatase PAH1
MAISNDEGIFDLVLTGTERLPLGMRSLYLVVVGDLTGAQFLALVLAPGTAIAVSDIDGTLTSSENAYPKSLVSHALVKPNDGAPAALRTLKGRGYPLVYVTSRGNRFTQDTRDWLQTNEFPLGPVRLASSLITLPGNETFEYKCQVLKAFNDDKLVVAIGLGNRATDQEAYSHSQCGAPVAANRTFLKMPEFQREVQPLLDRGLAIGVNSYVDVEPTFAALPAASMTESAGAK